MRVHRDWLLTSDRAAIHEPTATAVIADLHLGYDQARRRGGEAVPQAGLNDVLAPLASVFVAGAVRRLIVAGDLFEGGYSALLVTELLEWLHRRGVELAGVVPGNHDRGLEQAKDLLPLFPEGVSLGPWRIVHGNGELPSGRLVLGHFHPCLRWSRRLAAPCYLVRPDRLLLPAYSADAAGVSVLGQGAWQLYRCYALVGNKILDFGEVGSLRRRNQGSGTRRIDGRRSQSPIPDP